MNRAHRVGLRLAGVAVAAILLCSRVNGMQVKSPASPAAPQTAAPAQEEPAQQDEDQNPFMPEPAGPLPAGMTGSDANDPRANLTPGLYDAGETSMGLKPIFSAKEPWRSVKSSLAGSTKRGSPSMASGSTVSCHLLKGMPLYFTGAMASLLWA